jgi:hypothetical protein
MPKVGVIPADPQTGQECGIRFAMVRVFGRVLALAWSLKLS